MFKRVYRISMLSVFLMSILFSKNTSAMDYSNLEPIFLGSMLDAGTEYKLNGFFLMNEISNSGKVIGKSASGIAKIYSTGKATFGKASHKIQLRYDYPTIKFGDNKNAMDISTSFHNFAIVALINKNIKSDFKFFLISGYFNNVNHWVIVCRDKKGIWRKCIDTSELWDLYLEDGQEPPKNKEIFNELSLKDDNTLILGYKLISFGKIQCKWNEDTQVFEVKRFN